MDDREIQNERYVASITNYLIQTGSEQIAKLFAQSSLEYWEDVIEDEERSGYIFYLPPRLYHDLDNKEISRAINKAIEGVIGYAYTTFRVQIVEYDVNWRMRFIAEAETHEVSNQNNLAKDPILFQGMKFSSPPEVAIAKSLEAKGVMYFPNCLVRVGTKENRQTRYPDFLIHHLGKWGILEVDGQTYHTPQSATKDHERTQAMQLHGKIYVARFEAQRCTKDAEGVVSEFLKLLEING